MISAEAYQRMDSLTLIEEEANFGEATRALIEDFYEEGFSTDEIREFLFEKIDRIHASFVFQPVSLPK